MSPEVRLRLLDEHGHPFMGIGVLWLLDGIDRSGSLAGAARGMKLSYPKALRMVRELEEALGQPLVARERGGCQRGGAALTPFGERFRATYRAWLVRVEELAREEFAHHFAGLS